MAVDLHGSSINLGFPTSNLICFLSVYVCVYVWRCFGGAVAGKPAPRSAGILSIPRSSPTTDLPAGRKHHSRASRPPSGQINRNIYHSPATIRLMMYIR
ncbi:hypothetical protein PoB_006427500 [Plakobranchus ocellatus]|uniref:Uncharacterized protein n=1 Tax=Plakobranchus ocellatus TaxID=259542 RepID=A0AAV4D164_9GAST|nr:hypothetical protein PoB_006427500 [Plakobranchus ocellatus]